MTEVLRLANGLTVLAEEIPFLRSTAFSLAIAAGCRDEPADRLGLASLVCEMVQRGAGSRDSRELMGALDLLGADRSASVGSPYTSFSAAVPAESFAETLALYADMVQRPHLPADQLDDARRGALLELQASADDLAGRVLKQVRRMHFGDPMGRDPLGDEAGIEAVSLDDIRGFFREGYQPQGAILAIAGRFDWTRLRDQIEACFGTWRSGGARTAPLPQREAGYAHLSHSSQQIHLAFTLPAIPYRDPRQMTLQGAVGVLGSGVSSRLFTRVREERGLCYSISASYTSSLTQGCISVYAGTTPTRAQETLDVAWREMLDLAQGIETDELERLKIRLSSMLVLELESSSSRASAMVSDWYHFGRVVSAEEIQREIDALEATSMVALWREHLQAQPCLATLGPDPLVPPWAPQLSPTFITCESDGPE